MGTYLFDKTKAGLERTRADYESLRRHFDTFCAQATREDGGPSDSRYQPIVRERDGDALVLKFAGRMVRATLRTTPGSPTGKIIVQDMTSPYREPGVIPTTVFEIEFEYSGKTNLTGGEVEEVELSNERDCAALVLHIVASSLAFDPWAVR